MLFAPLILKTVISGLEIKGRDLTFFIEYLLKDMSR